MPTQNSVGMPLDALYFVPGHVLVAAGRRGANDRIGVGYIGAGLRLVVCSRENRLGNLAVRSGRLA